MPKGQAAMQFILKSIWPWFRDHIWPLLRDDVVAAFKDFVENRKRWLEEFLARNTQREAMARQKADAAGSAETSATAAGDPTDAHAHAKVASAWREVAETLRRENESLKRELSALALEETDVVTRVEGDLDLTIQGDRPALLFGTGLLALPEREVEPPPFPKCPSCGTELK